jgi:hydrogenase expression/formation protein HypC
VSVPIFPIEKEGKMCLGIPMKLVEKSGDLGVVDSGGLRKNVNLSFMKTASLGDYILIHAGFAIEKIKEKEAKKTLKALEEING